MELHVRHVACCHPVPVIQYREAMEMICADRGLGLRAYELSTREWDILTQLRDVLKVCGVSKHVYLCLLTSMPTNAQATRPSPHAPAPCFSPSHPHSIHTLCSLFVNPPDAGCCHSFSRSSKMPRLSSRAAAQISPKSSRRWTCSTPP